MYNVSLGDCYEVMKGMEDNSVDSIVTDPPYGIGFMGKKWDKDVPAIDIWKEALRVAKPGSHLLAFGGTRTFHRLMVAIEDAGWELRDTIMWVYATGFPKSLDISKAIDKSAGAERETVGEYAWPDGKPRDTKTHSVERMAFCDVASKKGANDRSKSAPSTTAAKQWEGWGTALKPAYELIIVARKPLVGTVAQNVLMFGVGGMNIDACRVETSEKLGRPIGSGERNVFSSSVGKRGMRSGDEATGRFPANLIHDGSEEVTSLFPESKSGGSDGIRSESENYSMSGKNYARETAGGQPPSIGSAARFFYCAKARPSERNIGDGEPRVKQGQFTNSNWSGEEIFDGKPLPRVRNTHPTVKPIALMRYLCKLVTPIGATVFDPFMGSGTTGVGAILEGMNFIGIEKEAEHLATSEVRLAHAAKENKWIV